MFGVYECLIGVWLHITLNTCVCSFLLECVLDVVYFYVGFSCTSVLIVYNNVLR